MSNGYLNFNIANGSLVWQLVSFIINKSFSTHLVLPWFFFFPLFPKFSHPQSLLIFPLWQLSTHPILFIVTIMTTYSSQSCRVPPGLSHFQSLRLQPIQNYHCRVKFSNALVLCYCHYMMNNLQWFPIAILVESKLSLACIAMAESSHTYLDLDHSLLWVLCSSPPCLLALTSLTLILQPYFLLLPSNHYQLKECSRTSSLLPPSSNSRVSSCVHYVPTLQHGELLCQCLPLHLNWIVFLRFSMCSLAVTLLFNQCLAHY